MEKQVEGGNHLKSTLVLVSLAAVIIITLGIALTMDPKQVPSPLIGKTALPFKAVWVSGQENLKDANENGFQLEHFRGKPVILNFWASWCVSCRAEAHELETFWKKAKGDGVYVVGVAIQDEKAAALDFAAKYGKTYILGLDVDGSAAINYGVTGVPETFFIGEDGQIKDKIMGPVTLSLLVEGYKKLTSKTEI